MMNYKLSFLFDTDTPVTYSSAEKITGLSYDFLREELNKINNSIKVKDKDSSELIVFEDDKIIIPSKLKNKLIDIYFNRE